MHIRATLFYVSILCSSASVTVNTGIGSCVPQGQDFRFLQIILSHQPFRSSSRVTASALLKRFGSTALSLSSARLWNSFPPSRMLKKSASFVLASRTLRLRDSRRRSRRPATCCCSERKRQRVAHRPVALPRNEGLLASRSEQSVEPERLQALFSIHSLRKVDDSSWLGLAFMHDLKIPGIQIQADVLSNLLRIKRTDKLGWNGKQPTRSAFLCINRLIREHCAENGRLRS